MCEMIVPFILGDEAHLLSAELDSCLIAAILLAGCNVSYRQHFEQREPKLRRFTFMGLYTAGTFGILCFQAFWLASHGAMRISLFSRGLVEVFLLIIMLLVVGRTVGFLLDFILTRSIWKGLTPKE